MKKTKLTEKSARIPDTRPFQWEKVIKRYIQEVEHQQTESAKATRFAILTQELFGVEPNFIDNYVSGIEKYIKIPKKDRILRGRVDNLFGNLVSNLNAIFPNIWKKPRNRSDAILLFSGQTNHRINEPHSSAWQPTEYAL